MGGSGVSFISIQVKSSLFSFWQCAMDTSSNKKPATDHKFLNSYMEFLKYSYLIFKVTQIWKFEYHCSYIFISFYCHIIRMHPCEMIANHAISIINVSISEENNSTGRKERGIQWIG